MNIKVMTLIGTLGLSLLSAPSFASDASGAYIGAGAGMSGFNDDGFVDDVNNQNTGSADSKASGTALNVYGGYYFNKIVGVEANYIDYGKVKFDGIPNKFSPSAFSLSANLGYTFDNGVRPFALLGLGSINFDESNASSVNLLDNDSGSSIHWGVGVEYTPPAIEHLALRASFQGDTAIVDAFDWNGTNVAYKDYALTSSMVGVGVAYKF